jgi:L-amino acid N-acyltransferase YncA
MASTESVVTGTTRHINLDDGRALVVRPARDDDVDGLLEMYEQLPPEDLYRRFFSCHRPDRAFFEAQVRVHERGGFALVVELEPPDSGAAGQIVADAWYSLMADGDGELAITVAKAWRGWLGPYLLDTLLNVAGARGIRNLQAEILTGNRSMMALARGRGYVTVDDDDASTVRVALGATTRSPGWPAKEEHPRVLVEHGGGRWPAAAEARRAGMHVFSCPGPRGGLASPRCPAIAGETCPLAADADAIVLARPTADAVTRALVDAHTRLHPDVPLFVQLSDPRADVSTLPPGARVIPASLPPSEVVRLLEAPFVRAE